MLERFQDFDTYYAGRSDGLVDLAWFERVLPGNDGVCPIDNQPWPTCGGHGYSDEALRDLVAPVLTEWAPHMRRREHEVVARMLNEWGLA